MPGWRLSLRMKRSFARPFRKEVVDTWLTHPVVLQSHYVLPYLGLILGVVTLLLLVCADPSGLTRVLLFAQRLAPLAREWRHRVLSATRHMAMKKRRNLLGSSRWCLCSRCSRIA